MKKTEDFKKVWVWDDAKKKAKEGVQEVYLLSELPDGRYATFSLDNIDPQSSNNNVHVWDHCSETDPNIKTKRFMTREEILIDNLDHPRRLNRYYQEPWKNCYDFLGYIETYEYIDIPETYKGDFSDLEVKKYEVEE